MTLTRSKFPNQPYKDPKDAIVHAKHWRKWASRMHEVGDYNFDIKKDIGAFKFSRGGFQDGRGGGGSGVYIESVHEELDVTGEWYYDAVSHKLYLYHNATSGQHPSPGSLVAIAAQATTLINITGTQDEPVKDIQINGIGLRDTAYTYMHPHGMPSGGDWALQRHAALILEGTQGVSVDGCVFERLDGNAIIVSGYGRNVTIIDNSFSWIGDTAIALWGRTKGDPLGVDGWDGRDGNQPRYTQVVRNIAREVGVWEKQSSMLFQAKSSDANATGNIFFNGPRAAINFNDGFAGGSLVDSNILFNTVRETGDHSAFNSWDRQPYFTYRGNMLKANDTLTRNIIIINYGAGAAVDNDDGSFNYNTHHNVFVYNTCGFKSDYGGHSNHHHHNLYAFANGGNAGGQHPPVDNTTHADYFISNVVVMKADGDYGGGWCPNNGRSKLGDPWKVISRNNTVYSPTANVTECKLPLEEFQKYGYDIGTVAKVTPSVDEILGIARKVLGI